MKPVLNPESRLKQLIEPLNTAQIAILQQKMNEIPLLPAIAPLLADGVFGAKSKARLKQLAPLFGLPIDDLKLPTLLDLLVISHPFAAKIKQNHLSPAQYYPAQHTAKKGVLLHHTVSGENPNDVRNYFENKSERVGTHFCIGGDALGAKSEWNGVVVQLFPLLYWAHHINTYMFNETHNKATIGVEICCWGMLEKEHTTCFTRARTPRPVPDYQIETVAKKFNGGLYFHKYTIAQARVVVELLCYLRDIFEFDFSETDWNTFFDLNKEMVENKIAVALTAHTTWRKPNEKSDIYPSTRMRVVLQAVSKYGKAETALKFFDENIS